MNQPSHCAGHYPRIRFENGRRLLVHPVSGMLYADRPEERVRFRSLDYVLQHRLWPASHITTEKKESTRGEIHSGRVDILLYNLALQPEVLIECKAPSVRLTEATGKQIARYNTDIQARILGLTNGTADFWYLSDGTVLQALPSLPESLQAVAKFHPSPEYWVKTGFTGSKCAESVRHLLNRWFANVQNDVICLNPGLEGTVAGFSHYYKIWNETGKPVKWAATVAADAHGKTILTVIRNMNRHNDAVLFLPLDAVYLKDEVAYQILGKSGTKKDLLTDEQAAVLQNPGVTSFPEWFETIFKDI